MVLSRTAIVVGTGALPTELGEQLRRVGHQVVVATDARERLRVALEHGGDLVLVAADQLQAARSLLQHWEGGATPALLAVCHAGDGIEAAMGLADDVLMWPDDRAQLAARVQRGCRQRAAEAEARLLRAHTRTLQELAGTLCASLEFEDLLHEALARLVECTGGALALALATRDNDSVLYVLGSSEDRTAVRIPVAPSAHPEAKRVIDTMQEVFARADSAEPAWAVALSQRELEMVWALPLRWRGKAYGSLELGFERAMDVPEATQDFVRVAAGLIGVSLRGSELYRSLHEQTQRWATVMAKNQQVAETLEKYKEFFQHAADGVLVLDREYRVLHINPAGEQITGYASAGLVGSALTDIIEERDRDRLVTALEAISPGASPSFDLSLVTTSGDSILVSASPNELLGGGEVLALSFRDVTEARTLENELRGTKEFLERLIDSTSDAIVATDVGGLVILFNKGAEQLFQMSASDVVGKLFLEDLCPPGVATKVMEQLRGAEDGGVGRLRAVRKEVLNDSQERVPVSLSANLIYEDEREVGTVVILGDLRERLLIEQRLAQAQERLVETEKQALLAELAGTTAHELNQPLTSVMGYAELLKRRVQLDETMQRAVDTILREAERMAEIVRKIGKITRYETKTYVGGTQILDLERSSKE